MIRLALALSFAVLLAGRGAIAEPAEPDRSEPARVVAASSDTAAEPVAEARPARRRLTATERWRGKPYLRSEDSLIRGQALDMALPPSAPTFSTGGVALQAAGDGALRKQALDMALPGGVNRILPGGF